jgi:SAM-dependent methyltransferase
LEVARDSGFKVYGCDLQRSPGLDSSIEFHVGDLHSSGLPNDSFDCIVLRNTLEHLFDPAAELLACHRLLRPGGFLYLKLPNGDYEHGWRCRIMHGRANVFGPPWHLNYFTRPTLQRLLRQSGFAVSSWLIESPTPGANAVRNAIQSASVAAFRAARLLSLGTVFPKPLLTCMARKTPVT